MTIDQDGRLRALAEAGRWAELLAAYRQVRATIAAGHGERAAAARTAPIGHLIAYGAPPELASRLFDADAGPGSTATTADHDAGPLWEVLATRHTWRRLAPLLGPTEVRRLVAHTRALLGEDLRQGAEPDPRGVPLALAPWEAAGWDDASPVREYLRRGGARRALLALPGTREGLGPVELPEPGGWLDGSAVTRLLAGLVPGSQAAGVRGAAPEAVARLMHRRWVTGGYLPFAAVYPALVQAASAGAAHGSAHGRLAVWRVLAALTGEPAPSVARIDRLVARLRCFTWCEPDGELWYLHLALEDPERGLAWAVTAAHTR